MELIKSIEDLVNKICTFFPEIDKNAYRKKIAALNLKQNEDFTDLRPISYDYVTHSLNFNVDEIGKPKYDAEYLMAVNLLVLSTNYEPSLNGLRYGYFAGVASTLLTGNGTLDEENLEPVVDPYEVLRDFVQDLGEKIGPDKACNLCMAGTMEVFHELCLSSGLENPASIADQLNYLLENGLNIDAKRKTALVQSLKNQVSAVKPIQKTM